MGILDVFKKPEGPTQPSAAGEISFSHEGSFVTQVLSQELDCCSNRGLFVEPGRGPYQALVRFMAQNVERLSHAIELGHPFIGTQESPEVLQRLTGFMRYQQRALFRGEGWAQDLGDSMELRVARGFSVARTEIYPEQSGAGVCYHVKLDLYRGDHSSPIIALERYMVSRGRSFTVVRDGAFALGMLTGALIVDLDISPIDPNVAPPG